MKRFTVVMSVFVLTLAAHAQVHSPTKLNAERDVDGKFFNGRDRLYIMVEIDSLLNDPNLMVDDAIGLSPASYEIEVVGTGKKFQPAYVYVLAGGLALFGNYQKDVTYRVTVLRDIPVFDSRTRQSRGAIPAGTIQPDLPWEGKGKWNGEGNSGLRGQKTFEFTPSMLNNTLASGSSSSFSFDVKAAYAKHLTPNFYVDTGADSNVAVEQKLAFNQTEAHLNFGYRHRVGKIKLEMTNKLQGNQKFDQIDYAIGAQANFLPPLAISWFSKRFAWDPVLSTGYEWAREIDRGQNDTTDSVHRLTYGLYWVVPIADRFALSLEGSGVLELIKPIKPNRFHDKTVVSFFVLIHEKDQVKVETALQYKRGEAPPSFTFNQAVLLGLFFKIR